MGIFFTIVFIAIVAFAVYKYATKSDPLNKADQRPKSQSEEPVTFYKMGATSIIDLIDLDLRSMPDEYSVLESEEDGAKHYVKSLPHKQFGIFDSLTTIVTKSGTMNFIFRTKRDDVRQGQIEKLVNTIYVMYGKDSMGDGVFSQKDIDDLKADFFDRRWHDAKIPVAVSEDEGLFEMTIWSNFVYTGQSLGTPTFIDTLENGQNNNAMEVQTPSSSFSNVGTNKELEPEKVENSNFIAIDFETATEDRMPCQLGIAVVRNGEIVEKINELIQPPSNQYCINCMMVHGIGPEQTKDSPTFDVVWERIKQYFDQSFIIAHNAAFDLDVLKKALDYYMLPHPVIIGTACTYKISGATLKDACIANDIPLSSHHDGGCDAEACAMLYLKHLSKNLKIPKCTTSKTEDHRTQFFNEHKHLEGDILQKDLSSADPNNPFYNRKVVITGTFIQDRIDIANRLKEMGADINTSISKKTDFVLVGKAAGPKKIEKIEQLKKDGYDIKCLYQKDLDSILSGNWEQYKK